MQSVTLQTLSRLLDKASPLLRLLTDAGAVVTWNRYRKIPLNMTGWDNGDIQFLKLAKALLATSQRKQPRSIEELIDTYCTFEGVERTQFLHHLAASLEENAVLLGGAHSKESVVWKRFRFLLQRWALSLLDEEVLFKLYKMRKQRA